MQQNILEDQEFKKSLAGVWKMLEFQMLRMKS